MMKATIPKTDRSPAHHTNLLPKEVLIEADRFLGEASTSDSSNDLEITAIGPAVTIEDIFGVKIIEGDGTRVGVGVRVDIGALEIVGIGVGVEVEVEDDAGVGVSVGGGPASN